MNDCNKFNKTEPRHAMTEVWENIYGHLNEVFHQFDVACFVPVKKTHR